MSGFTSDWRFHDPHSSSSHTVTRSSTHPTSFTISIDSGPNTDWWTTAPGSQPESSAHRDSGPVVYQTLSLASSQDWKLSGKVTQRGTERFQQTTLFIQRLDPSQDKQGQAWLKSGIENEGGRKYVGVVATNPYSDWNVSPLSREGGESVEVEIEKQGPDVHVYYTVGGERFLLREKKGFVDVRDEKVEEWWIGAMVCGPLSAATQGTVEDCVFELLDKEKRARLVYCGSRP